MVGPGSPGTERSVPGLPDSTRARTHRRLPLAVGVNVRLAGYFRRYALPSGLQEYQMSNDPQPIPAEPDPIPSPSEPPPIPPARPDGDAPPTVGNPPDGSDVKIDA